MKPEFFCCIGGELKDTIQGIFKCSRVFIYRAAENQTIDDMLVDGFFNEADDIRVNDLIILYCPEQTRAYTFAKVSSIIGGIVKTKELDTPNLPANVSAFFNDVGYLTAADLATVALTGNLSDLNDTTITNPATGEYLRWNGAKWINMAGGGSAVWGSVGGNIADQADLQLALAGKANVDLDNLTDTGANIANWSSNVTNCITQIPQDIILELNAGTLTLKAGSKAYNANGLLVTTTSDLNATWAYTGTANVVVTANGQNLYIARYPGETVSTLPSPTTSYKVYFNTTDGKCYFDNGSMIEVSFPVAVITANGQINDIKYTFNGFGYIGSTVFALPGVKGLIPDGRNADGTLKNIEFTTNGVLTYTNIANYSGGLYVQLKQNDITGWITYYNGYCFIGNSHWTSGKVDWFTPKTVFRAFDYNDVVNTTLAALYPVGSIYIGTQATCPLATLIPGSTWQQIQGRYLLASGTLAGTGETYPANYYVAAGLPNTTGAMYDVISGYADGTFALLNEERHLSAGSAGYMHDISFNAGSGNSMFGQSTTNRPAAYVVNVWRRTA